jgi:hypothetical protein
MIRLSIRTLMAVVVVCAVGMTALRNANELWAGTMMLVALTAVGVALLGAIILKGRERYWWLGFAVFSGGFLAIALAPGLSTEVMPRLVTTRMITKFHADLVAAAEATVEREQADQEARIAIEVAAGTQDVVSAQRLRRMTERRHTTLLLRIHDRGPFSWVGHSLFALLAGLVGATVGAWFYARRERPRARAASG